MMSWESNLEERITINDLQPLTNQDSCFKNQNAIIVNFS